MLKRFAKSLIYKRLAVSAFLMLNLDLNRFKSLSDIEIWEYARENSFTIITNDDDFYRLSLMKGFPPKVVVIRIGNQSTLSVGNKLLQNKDAIQQFYTDEDYGVFELY